MKPKTILRKTNNMSIPVITADFNQIEKGGYIQVNRHEIATYLTEGNLVILTNSATATTKYATLYESTPDHYHFRIQD